MRCEEWWELRLGGLICGGKWRLVGILSLPVVIKEKWVRREGAL